MMKVLIMGEYSGNTRRAFRALGHEAWSCDFLPAEDNSPYHLQCDVMTVLDDGWDLMIAHPDCTYLTNSAEWCYKDDPGKKMSPGVLFGAERREARDEAAEFFMKLWRAKKIKSRMIENPVGVMSTRFRRPDQIIQPYNFGHDASKKTCMWLDSLSLSCAQSNSSSRASSAKSVKATIVTTQPSSGVVAIATPGRQCSYHGGRIKPIAIRTSSVHTLIDGRIARARIQVGRGHGRCSGVAFG